MRNKDAKITRTLHTAVSLHVREANEGGASSRTITGYAILFNVPSIPLYASEDEETCEVIDRSAITGEFLNGCDIKMTIFHDRQQLLARSKKGRGTLKYEIDDKGVSFEFEAPDTADGDKALELIKRGDISGCSFMFSTYYYDGGYVARSKDKKGNKTITTYTVNKIVDIYDFTLAADPYYQNTNCEVATRELIRGIQKNNEKIDEQVREMRNRASRKLEYV